MEPPNPDEPNFDELYLEWARQRAEQIQRAAQEGHLPDAAACCFCGESVPFDDAARLLVLEERHADEPDAGIAQMWAHKACVDQAILPGHRYFPWDEEG